MQDTYPCAPYHKCNAVTGELPSKFTALESHSYGVGYAMQMTKCISLLIMHSMGVKKICWGYFEDISFNFINQ